MSQELLQHSTEADEMQCARLPLSFAQERLWFLHQLEPESAGYNVPGAILLRGELDVERLEQALNLVIARHENLRTLFPSEEGQPYQQILDRIDFRLERIDLGDRETREEEAKALCRADAAKPFDLARGPLLRGKVIRLAEDEHVLMLNMHHIISDGWSIGVLLKELRVILDSYRQGREPQLPALPIQYADYAVWQRQWLEDEGVLAQQLAYWQTKLADAPESLDLAFDFPRPDVPAHSGGSFSFVVDAALTAQCKRMAEQQGATLFMALLAVFKVLIHRYTGQGDLCVGTPIANRQQGETEGLIGLFINTLALRTRVEPTDTFATLLSRVKTTCLEAYENQDAPFEKIVDALRLQRNFAISPLFQVMLVLQNTERVALDPSIEPYAFDAGVHKFDLTLDCTESPDGLSASIRYGTALYERQTIARMADHFLALLRAVVASPSIQLQHLDYVSAAEKQQLLTVFNGENAEEIERCLHDFFVEQAARCADRTAVICGEERLTYQQLEERSRALALVLQSQGIGPDSLVGLCVERSLHMVVGLLGILRAGGAYVPLDPEDPDERIAYKVSDSRAAVVLTQSALKDRLRGLIPAAMPVVALDGDWTEIAARSAALNAPLAQDVAPHNLAYVIYTSGSTGQPKGVMVEHRQVVRYATSVQERLQVPENVSFALVSTFAADLGNTVLFPSLMSGGTLHVLTGEVATDPRAYAAYFREHRIDCMKITPSHLQALVGDRKDAWLIPAHTLVFGGELLSPSVVRWVHELQPACRVFNHYGPTECTVGVLSGEAVSLRRRSVPLGAPLAGTRIYVVDPQGQPVPIGVPGELLIGGAQVTRGYLNRPELTAERFLPDRFASAPGARVYKTGDTARWCPDGTIEYLGRNDFQVKIRGFRVEPGEIEAQLAKHAAVREALVIAREDEPGDKRLVAYVTLTATASLNELRAHLQSRVPQSMVPSAFVILDAMPLTPNGKVDRKALPRPEAQPNAGEKYEPPQGIVEETLCAIWQELLGVARVGRTDNFFELGGHSLLATRLMSKIRTGLGVDLPLRALFEGSTVAQLAASIAKGEQSDIPSIPRADRSRYESLPLSFAQERLWFLNQLAPNTAGYNISRAVKISGAFDVARIEAAFNAVIARHENLRTVFPSVDGEPRQRILEALDFRVQRIDLSGLPANLREVEARRLCETEAATPFDLATGPLLRCMVIALGADEHILMMNLHHIISDGWSHPVLMRELRAALTGAELPPLPIQYADYSVWQRQWLQESGVLERQLGYWQRKLAGVPERVDLPTDFPRPSVQTYAGANHRFALDASLTARLRQLGEREGATLYMVLLAAFKALVYRYTEQGDLCVGSPIANRQYGETEGLIGMFVNTLAMRSQVDGGDSFAALLARVKTTCLEAYEHQDAPFERVVEALQLPRNLATTPLFQAMLVLQNNEAVAIDGSMEPYLLETCVSKFDLTWIFAESADGLVGFVEYNTDLYKEATIARMTGHFVALCDAVTTAPAAEIGQLEYLGAAEKHALLLGFNDTAADYQNGICLHELFEEQAVRSGEDLAVLCGDERLTYRQLDQQSRQLAVYLQSQGVGPDHLVGVCMERSPNLIVSLLAVLRAGGAYVPLDPDYPTDRLAYMVRDSRAAIVLTQESLLEKLGAQVEAGVQLLALDRQWPQASGRVLQRDVRPQHLSHIIYTSGSTGQPKGVAIEHHSSVTLVQWGLDVYSTEELSRVLASTSICFDLSVYEIFLTLASGGTIQLVRNALALADGTSREGVTLINTVPSAIEELVRLGAVPASVQTINLAGEPLPARLVDRIYETTSAKKVYDLYGPSEDTTYSTYTLRTPKGPQTIGRPLARTKVYILDRRGQLQPIGVPGELHIAGDGLARGYLYRPELTEQKFVANPFEPGTRMYKTGDLARWTDAGTLQYLGRIDTQVKVRGFRIEMGEIEARLGQHDDVQDAAVIAQGEGAEKKLIAFYRAKETTANVVIELPAEELRDHLLRTLPAYMVPAAFVSLAAIPLSPNGKVDRRALARIDVAATASSAYAAPRNETETELAALWAEVLNVGADKIGIHDHFFERGGHSLLATRLIAKIRSWFGVDLPLKALFESGTVAQLAARIAQDDDLPAPAIVPADRTKIRRLPLSYAQERLWFLDQLAPNNAAYNIPTAMRIRRSLDLDQVEAAFQYVIARHEMLRTIFPSDEGLPQQKVLDSIDCRLRRIDLRGLDRDARDAEGRRLCAVEAATPFDLAKGPLIRGTAITLADDEFILMLTLHHIISDGWSHGILIRELGTVVKAFNEGRVPELRPLPIQYADYSVWQRRLLEEEGVLDRQLAYWKQKLAGAPEMLDLPTDFPRPNAQTFSGSRHFFSLDAKLIARLKKIAEQNGSTLYMVLLSALKVLLHRYTGQSDLCVGTPIANRQYVETEGLIGMFVNTLAMRTLVEGNDTFVDVLAKVKTTCLEAYERQDAPFEKVVQALNVRRNLVTTPLFQVMAVLQNMDMGMNEGSGQIAYSLGGGVSKFDLTVFFTESADGLEGILDYKTALYKAETAARMAANFVALCQAIVSAPAAAIRTLDYLSDEEKQSLLVRNNDTAVDYPKDRCLHDLFFDRAAQAGEQTAVTCGEERLTYRQLEERSRDLAVVLQSQGVTADSLVGVCMERSLEMVVSLVAILRAGGAYVPLDPEYPDERLAYMLEDSGAALVLTQQSLRDRVTALSASTNASINVQAVDAQWAEIELRAAELRAQNVQLEARATANDLAYVIYTSGSTGRPKGVMVEHRSVVNYVTYAVDQYVGTGEDACASFIHFPLTFDASVTSLFAPLLAGKAIDIDRREAIETFKDGKFLSRGYDFVKMTPAHLLLLRSHAADLPRRFFEKKNVLVVGGEALTRDCVDFLGEVGARVEIVNEYGPTEATVGCTTFRFAAGDALPSGEDVSIGKPIANTQIYVLDAYGHPQPAGVPGELYIAGDCLARGYLHREDLTQERFVANPFVPGARMYKTGDLARWRDDGNLQYLGRIDTQVKIRGFRIELGEIEARLNQHAGVLDNAVVAQGSGADRQLVAFYRAASVLPQDELRAHLQQALPEYMLPAAFMRLETIPLTTNGKVDRRALERMKVTIASSADYVAPRNETERRLVAIWAEVLNRPAELIGVHDDFFDLGGHSLSAVQLMAKASRQFRQMLPLAVLFTAPDVASLAKLIASDQELASDILVPIQPHGDAQPVFAVPGAGGNVLSLQPLSRTLGDRQPFFALQAVGLDGKTPPHRSVEATAEANIAALKTVQPSGPYQLVGHSYGGVVAYEMARMLLERGEEISSLTLVDSLAPSVMRGHRVHDEVSDLVEAFRAIADRNGAEFDLDVEALRESSFDDVIAEMADLLTECGVEIDARQLATFYRVYRANVLCYDAYMPSLLPRTIDVSLYRATQGRAERNLPHDYGWDELLQSPIHAADVHADHFSILTEMSF